MVIISIKLVSASSDSFVFVADRNMSHGNVGSQVERKERMDSAKFTVDRETTCPLLLRVFCSTSRHNSMSDYMKGEEEINHWRVNLIFYFICR